MNPGIYAIARELPGRRKWRGKELIFELSRANIQFLQNCEIDIDWQTNRVEEIRILEELEEDAKKAKLRPLPPEANNFRFQTEPREHQLRAFMLSRDRMAFGLFLEQGLGKTKIIIDTAAHLWATGKINTVLVVAPNGVHQQWLLDQVPIHMPEWVDYKCGVYASYMKKKQKDAVESALAHDGLRLIGMNQEAFATKKGVAFAERVLFSGEAMFVIDESISIKTPGAQRTKNILKLRDAAPYRRILTGTPITRGVEDLFSQLKFLHEDVHGFSSFWSFKHQYCIETQVPGAPRGATQIVGYKNLDQLKNQMDGWTMRLTIDECLDLPERTRVTRHITATDLQRKIYDELKEEFLTQLDSGEIVTADQAVTRLLRLQQVLCGHTRDEQGNVHRLPSNRASAALAVAQESQGKVVHWARFQEDIDILMDVLKDRNPVMYDGRVSNEDRREAKKRFIEDDECLDFVANPAAAGMGVDGLQHVSHTMCYYSNSFRAVDRWQSESRLHRDGQKGTVAIIDLVVPNTVDQYILKILRNRKDVAEFALDVRDQI